MRFSGARMGFRCQIAGSRGGFHWATAGGSRWASAHKIGFARGFEFGRRGGWRWFLAMRSGARLSSGVAFKGATARGKALGAHKVESALVKYTVTCDMFLSLFRRVEERREKILRKKKKKKI
jgi:hypothetical protein